MRSKLSKLTLLPLILLIVSAVDGNRNLPAAAIFGSPLVFYFLLGTVIFLLPVALVSSQLAVLNPEKEGIYYWIRDAFGEKWGVVAIWLQWANTIVWFPTILSFIAGSFAFIIDPNLIHDKVYMAIAIATIFWGLTLINLRGLSMSTRVNTVCALCGTLFPMCLLIALGGVWIVKGQPIAISLSPSLMVPQLARLDTWVALVAIMGSFLGMELAGVHLTSIHKPKTTFPLALGIATFVVLITMLLGSLAIAVVLPPAHINLAGGIMQVFAEFFRVFHLDYLIPIMTFLIIIGSIGGLINWMISPSKGILFAANHGFFPPFFARLNRHGVAVVVLVIQALCVSLLCMLFLFMPSVSGFYWFLAALSTGLYMLMYILMFMAAIVLFLQHRIGEAPRQFRIPGGRPGFLITCGLGILGSSLTFLLGFVPPPHIDIGNPLRYTCMIGLGNFFFLLPLLGLFWYKKRHSHKKLSR